MRPAGLATHKEITLSLWASAPSQRLGPDLWLSHRLLILGQPLKAPFFDIHKTKVGQSLTWSPAIQSLSKVTGPQALVVSWLLKRKAHFPASLEAGVVTRLSFS